MLLSSLYSFASFLYLGVSMIRGKMLHQGPPSMPFSMVYNNMQCMLTTLLLHERKQPKNAKQLAVHNQHYLCPSFFLMKTLSAGISGQKYQLELLLCMEHCGPLEQLWHFHSRPISNRLPNMTEKSMIDASDVKSTRWSTGFHRWERSNTEVILGWCWVP